MSKGPILIDLETRKDETARNPAEAPPVPDLPESAPTGAAMATIANLSARKPSRIALWFWSLLLSLVGAIASVAAWDFVNSLIARAPLLGWAVAAIAAAFIAVLLVIAIKELAGFARLKRMDHLHHAAQTALADRDLSAARDVVDRLQRLYKNREDMRWGRDRLADRQAEQFDAESLLGLAEIELLRPLDQAAQREVEAAARQVATVTALVPLAMADVVAALTANIRMIRRVAEIYGGRSGTLGSWRLTRAVMTHLVATGAVAVGDDMLEPIIGGGLLGKLSRRFGEGMVNGALTARVGVAAMEVCRPVPFLRETRPSVPGLVKRALAGLVTRG